MRNHENWVHVLRTSVPEMRIFTPKLVPGIYIVTVLIYNIDSKLLKSRPLHQYWSSKRGLKLNIYGKFIGKCLKILRITKLQFVIFLCKHPKIVLILKCLICDLRTNAGALRGVQKLTEKY